VAEIAPRYTTSDPQTGDTVATPELYGDQGDITLGYFRREGSLSATEVRDSLDTAMPGETRSPPQLIQITEATAKPARSSRETQQPAGRHKYFTEDEAERVDNLDATPAVWMLDQVAAATESHRPLDPVLSEIERFSHSSQRRISSSSFSYRDALRRVSDSTQTRYCRDE